MVFIRAIGFVWRQLESAFFGAAASVVALFDFHRKQFADGLKRESESIMKKTLSLLLIMLLLVCAVALVSCRTNKNNNTPSTDNGGTTESPSTDNGGTTESPSTGDQGQQDSPNAPVTASEGLEFTLNDDGASYSVTGIGICDDTDLVIPDAYLNLPVTSVGDRAFFDCTSITSVLVPNSVTSVGMNAFRNCSSLISITIGNSVIFIGDYAFENCDSLTSITFDGSIPSYSYADIKKLTTIIIEDGVTSIPDFAFYECKSLKNVTIPDSVTEIGDGAFDNCNSLLLNKYDNAYYLGNENSPYLVLFKTINDDVTSCEIYYGAKIIYSKAFYCHHDLESITIPDSVTNIGNYAFSECTSFTSITIPDSVMSIGEDAFYNCTSLTSIEVDENNAYYKSIDGNLYNKDGTTLIQYAIGKQDTSFTIPKSVTSIGKDAFYECTSLIDVYYTGDVKGWLGISYSNVYSTPMYYATNLYFNGELVRNIEIPDSVTSIGNYAFYNCTSLTSITIPNSVTSIDSGAFRYCTSLTSITIPDSVTSIGGSAFEGCTSITSVIIGDSVTSIGKYAFENCILLESITIPDSVTSIGDLAFYRCMSLTSITIPDSVASIGYAAFEDCMGLTSVTFENTNGWWYALRSSATSGTSISATNLSNPATAARYLRSTHCYKYWFRTE